MLAKLVVSPYLATSEASGTCSTGYHIDGTGDCVQAVCAAGYHVDGTGTRI
ncbi:MAG: hypothetical protein ACLP66_18565 [Polyangia bacterium]